MAARTVGSIEAVLFDYGMVLSTGPDPASRARMGEITGIDEEAFDREYWAHRDDYDRGALTGEDYWRGVGRGGGIVLGESQIAELIEADTELWGQPNEAMIGWARRLQDAGVRTGILSNLGDAMTRGLVAKLGWIGRFDHCTWSHALGTAKPDAAIYEHAAKGLGVAPGSILFLDDREKNVEGAMAAGMQTIQYVTHEQFEREMVERGFGYLLEPVGAAAATPQTLQM